MFIIPEILFRFNRFFEQIRKNLHLVQNKNRPGGGRNGLYGFYGRLHRGRTEHLPVKIKTAPG